MIIVLVLLGLYFLLNVYNLAWLFLPNLGKLRRIMGAYKVRHILVWGSIWYRIQRTTGKNAWEGDLDLFYYCNRDVQLLLNLLSSSSGLPGPLRSLALIDKEFNSACLPELVVNNPVHHRKYVYLLFRVHKELMVTIYKWLSRSRRTACCTTWAPWPGWGPASWWRLTLIQPPSPRQLRDCTRLG